MDLITLLNELDSGQLALADTLDLQAIIEFESEEQNNA